MAMKITGLMVSVLLTFSLAPGQWVHSGGPYYSTVRSFQVHGPNLLAGTFGAGVLLTTDNGTSWGPSSAGMVYTDVRTLAASGKCLYAGTGGGVYRSLDSGATWVAVDSGLTDGNVQAFALIGTSLFAGTGGGVFVTADSGRFWIPVDSGLANLNIAALAVIGTDLYAGTSGGVYHSADFGAIWTPTGLHSGINVLAVLDTILFAGTGSWSSGGSAFRTTDRGVTWTEVSSGLSGTPVLAFAVHRTNIFAGGSWVRGGGVFLSKDYGVSWALADSGLTEKDVTSLGCSETDLFAGTVVGGIWRRRLSEMVTSANRPSGGLPVRFSLFQNFPNPFNPSTVIRYGLPVRSPVRLDVFNALGQQVRTLVEGEQEAGYHEVTFDATGLSSGVYFYRLQPGDFTRTLRSLLLR